MLHCCRREVIEVRKSRRAIRKRGRKLYALQENLARWRWSELAVRQLSQNRHSQLVLSESYVVNPLSVNAAFPGLYPSNKLGSLALNLLPSPTPDLPLPLPLIPIPTPHNAPQHPLRPPQKPPTPPLRPPSQPSPSHTGAEDPFGEHGWEMDQEEGREEEESEEVGGGGFEKCGGLVGTEEGEMAEVGL